SFRQYGQFSSFSCWSLHDLYRVPAFYLVLGNFGTEEKFADNSSSVPKLISPPSRNSGCKVDRLCRFEIPGSLHSHKLPWKVREFASAVRSDLEIPPITTRFCFWMTFAMTTLKTMRPVSHGIRIAELKPSLM